MEERKKAVGSCRVGDNERKKNVAADRRKEVDEGKLKRRKTDENSQERERDYKM